MKRLADYAPPLDIYARWRLSRDDRKVKPIAQRLEQTWQTWRPSQKQLLLTTVERIVTAEQAKALWNPKVTGDRQRTLARLGFSVGVDAARLAELLPPPWTGERQVVGEQLTALINVMLWALLVSSWTPRRAAADAQQSLKRLRLSTPRHRGRVSYALIGQLAWLASGQHLSPLREDTIRHYLRPPSKGRLPAAEIWGSRWKAVQALAGLGSTSAPDWPAVADLLKSLSRHK